MKKHLIFLIAMIILIATVWFTTMAGINANREAQKENLSAFYVYSNKINQ